MTLGSLEFAFAIAFHSSAFSFRAQASYFSCLLNFFLKAPVLYRFDSTRGSFKLQLEAKSSATKSDFSKTLIYIYIPMFLTL